MVPAIMIVLMTVYRTVLMIGVVVKKKMYAVSVVALVYRLENVTVRVM